MYPMLRDCKRAHLNGSKSKFAGGLGFSDPHEISAPCIMLAAMAVRIMAISLLPANILLFLL